MPAPIDPDAALHAAQPGKFKPAGADPAAVPSASSAEPGTLSEGVERYPDPHTIAPTAAPLEHKQTWGEWLGAGWNDIGSTYHASHTLQMGDNGLGYESALRKGYTPIIDGLGLDATENPADFEQNGAANTLLTTIHYGLRDRGSQEQRLADLIRTRRAKDPNFMAGVPDDPVKLRAYAMAGDNKDRASAKAQLNNSTGLGGLVGSLGGSMTASFADPGVIATLPIGGGGKTFVQVFAREALVNGALAAATLPAVAQSRKDRGEDPLTVGEAVTDVAGAALAGSVLGTAMHGAGRALEATGLPQKLAGVVGNLDLANTISYKIYGAMPAPLQRKWGAAIVTKWARRLAAGEPLDDVFSNLSNVELATLSKTVIGEDHMTPEERAAAEHLTRTEEVGDSSPYEPTPAGNGAHEDRLEGALNDIVNNRPVQERPSAPEPSSDAGVGTPPAPARPPAATSTAARRPLRFVIEGKEFPRDIFDGLKARGIPDYIARGAAAGAHAESRGNINALGPITAATHGEQAFGIGQWLGGRKAELIKRYGPSPTLEQQLDFLAWELKGGDAGGKSVLAAKDEVDALHRYIRDFMRPGAGPETDKDIARGMAALGRKMDDFEPAGAFDGSAGEVVADDPNIARLREEALKLDDAVIGAPAAANVPPMYARQFRPDDITVDAARFQFKAGADELGVTDRLRGTEQWNPMYAGRVVTWEDAGGRVFLADGHQRYGLARRLEAEGHPPIALDALVLREADGVTAEDARVYAALKNIAEGTGSMVDAAKVIRGAGDHLLAHLPPKSALVRDARALASLSDEAFGAVYNDVLPADYAAVIGHLIPDRPEAHSAMVDLLVKTDPPNRGQAESIVRQGIAAGMHKAEQVDLFGEREIMQSLMLERAKVLERGLANLRKSKLLFNTAAKEADRLEAVGSKIAKSASEKEAHANAQALELVSRLAFTHGPIADALNDAARKLAAGAKLADVAAEFAAAVKRADLGALAGTVGVDDATRIAPDGAGRGGDAGEAVEAVREEQPSLIDLEGATKRFSDPDGAAVKQQAESAVHDFKAAIAEEDMTLGEEDFAHLSDREVAEWLTDEVLTDAIDTHAIRIGRELGLAHEAAGDPPAADYEALRKEIADKLLGPWAGEREKATKHAIKAIEDGRLKLQDLGEPPKVGPIEIAPSEVVPPPANPRKSADYAGPIMPLAEAKAKVEGWKAEAKRIGQESPPPPGTVILSLFDASGRWSQPYRDMGYEVVQLDIKHGHDIMQNLGHYVNAILDLQEKGGKIAGVIAQPPCTTFAGSGARWWDPRHDRNWDNAVSKMWGVKASKMFESPVEYNQFLVKATEELIAKAKPEFFAMENPRGRIAKLNGLPKANLELEPHHFGDAYTKNTFLYGKFNNELPTANVSPKEEHGGEGSKIHKLRSNAEKDDGLRSLTPEGFAYAFALANRPGTEAAERAGGRAGPSAADVATTRREEIKAASAELDGARRGELRTVEPFASEPGYHRFRYVAENGHAVSGTYTIDGNVIEGFNIGDTNNPVELGRVGLRKMLEQLRTAHPEAQYVHGYRMTGARKATGGGEKEVWFELTDQGAKFRGSTDPRAAAPDVRQLIADGQDTRGLGAQLHGARGEVPQLTEGYYNPDNIYGGMDTFYTTDSAHIAGGYRRKSSDGRIYHAVERDPVKAFNMEEQLPVAELERLLGAKPDDLGLVPSAIDEAASGGTASLVDVMDEIRHLSSGEGHSKHDVQEIFDTAIYNLREQGFGAMEHVGGRKTGKDPHRVKIYFDAPNQLDLHDVTPKGQMPAPKAADAPPPLDPSPLTTDGTLSGDKATYTAADVGPMSDGLRNTVDATDGKPAAQETILGAIDRGMIRDGDMLLMGNPRWALERGFAVIAEKDGTRKGVLTEAGRARLEDLRAASEAGAEPPTLDRGAQVDPALAYRQRQHTELAAASPLQSTAEQLGTMGLGLFDHHDQPTFRLGEEGGEISPADLLAELDADDKAIAALKGCL